MAKYYVESGQLRKIVEACSPIVAVATALAAVQDPDGLRDIELSRVVTVNERGFIRDRAYRQHDARDVVLETGSLISLIAEHELL